MQKKKAVKEHRERVPLCDSGESGAGLCIQFGDLIRRKRETHCRKFRRNQQE